MACKSAVQSVRGPGSLWVCSPTIKPAGVAARLQQFRGTQAQPKQIRGLVCLFTYIGIILALLRESGPSDSQLGLVVLGAAGVVAGSAGCGRDGTQASC